MAKQRFIVTAEFYVHAETKEEATIVAKAIAYSERMKYDNQYEILKVEETK